MCNLALHAAVLSVTQTQAGSMMHGFHKQLRRVRDGAHRTAASCFFCLLVRCLDLGFSPVCWMKFAQAPSVGLHDKPPKSRLRLVQYARKGHSQRLSSWRQGGCGAHIKKVPCSLVRRSRIL